MAKENVVVEKVNKKNGVEMLLRRALTEYSSSLETFHSYERNLMNSIEITVAALENSKEEKENPTIDKLIEFNKLAKRIDKYHASRTILPKSNVLTLIMIYDNFFVSLLKQVFKIRREMLTRLRAGVSADEIVGCDNKEQIENLIIEKNLETLMYKSHSDQIMWLEESFGITLDKKILNDFLFVTALRNVVAHNNGKVNEIFRKNIRGYGIKIKEKLEFSDLYCPCRIRKYTRAMIHFSIHLYTVLSKKIFKNDVENIDDFVNNICFEFLQDKNAQMAIDILEPIIKDKKKSANSEMLFMFSINLAIGYKLAKKENKMSDVLSSLDWSNCDDKFRFARAVLTEDNKKIYDFMEKFSDEKWKVYYKEWPLFYFIRESTEFREKYKEMYSEEYVIAQQKYCKCDILKKVAERNKCGDDKVEDC